MKLYFLRHGEADWPNWDKPDSQRPLTEDGKKELRRIARFLHKCDFEVDAIYSSPLPRAAQTAEIVATEFDMQAAEEKTLAPGFDKAALARLLVAHPHDKLLLVGHEPDFGEVIEALTGGAVKMSKAGLARVDLLPGSLHGYLVWLLPPRVSGS